MKDFLGNEYGVGDRVVYAAQSGRSATMVHAKVLEFKDNGNVVVQPLESSRWTQHYGRTRYIDSRNGKGIDPTFPKHHKVKEHWTRGDDPTVYTADGVVHVAREESGYTGGEYGPRYTYDYSQRREEDRRWRAFNESWKSFTRHKPVWADYVQKAGDGPRPVTLYVTENIVKVGGSDG